MLRIEILLIGLLLSVFPLLADNGEYKLNKGETLYRVSKKFDVPLELLISVNKIDDVTKVKAGTKLIIPRIHTVQKGETLYGIAKNYDVPLESLIEINHIDSSATIKPGDKLFIPLVPNNGKAVEQSKGGSSVQDIGSKKEGTKADVIRVNMVSKQYNKKKNRDIVGIASNKNRLFWPVEGEMVRVNGKIVGVKIRAKSGSKIISVSSGRVVWSSPYKGYGKVVFVESSKGYIYGYLGNSDLSVKVGDVVTRGSVIGRLSKNASPYSSLLFIIYRNGKPVDVFKAPRN